MINLVQENAECEEPISQTKHKAGVLERQVEFVARQVRMATTAMEEKVAKMAILKGRVEARQKMVNKVKKQNEDMTQATVRDCMESGWGELEFDSCNTLVLGQFYRNVKQTFLQTESYPPCLHPSPYYWLNKLCTNLSSNGKLVFNPVSCWRHTLMEQYL